MIEIQVPETIKIGGYDYRIDLEEKGQQELVEDNLAGRCNSRKKVILIDVTCPPQKFCNVFLHEVTHAVNDVYNDSEM